MLTDIDGDANVVVDTDRLSVARRWLEPPLTQCFGMSGPKWRLSAVSKNRDVTNAAVGFHDGTK